MYSQHWRSFLVGVPPPASLRFVQRGRYVAPSVRWCIHKFWGTVALSATGAEPALIGAATQHQFRGTHVFTMHFNTGFSAYPMPCVEWCGSMQQCPNQIDGPGDDSAA